MYSAKLIKIHLRDLTLKLIVDQDMNNRRTTVVWCVGAAATRMDRPSGCRSLSPAAGMGTSIRLLYGCSYIGFTCSVITVVTVILRAIDH